MSYAFKERSKVGNCQNGSSRRTTPYFIRIIYQGGHCQNIVHGGGNAAYTRAFFTGLIPPPLQNHDVYMIVIIIIIIIYRYVAYRYNTAGEFFIYLFYYY